MMTNLLGLHARVDRQPRGNAQADLLGFHCEVVEVDFAELQTAEGEEGVGTKDQLHIQVCSL